MAVNFCTPKFSEIGKSQYLFASFNYFKLRELIDRDLSFLQIPLSNYFEIISGFAFSSKDYMEKGVSVCRISDISKTGDLLIDEMLQLPEDYCELYEKYQIKDNDILIGMTGDGKYFKTCYVTDLKINVLLNQRVGILRPKKNINNFEPKFISLLLGLDSVQNQIKIVAMGKTQKNVSPFDILEVKIPNISHNLQMAILEKVSPFEREITTLKKSKLKPVDIINQVFGDEFNFDWSEFEKLKSQKIFTARLTDFANNEDCRFSFKFHNKAGKFVYDFLCSKSNKRIKDFISEPIVLGKSVSPSDYDEDGEFYYIAMSNIKSWAFDPEDCKKVTDSYSLANLNKTVQKDDILLARSGEGTIGKVALIEDEDIQGIFADFTQRIRLKNYNPRLAYYYFRSDFFQYLVYTHKKGLGNNTNIFPSQIQEFPIPDWSEEKQAEIVEKIKSQIDAQSTIDKEIENNMAKINLIIEDAISSTEGL